jgi:hypothetical protein
MPFVLRATSTRTSGHAARAPQEPAVSLQLADVHEAMKTVDRLFRRYYGLLKLRRLDDDNARRRASR